VITDVQCPAASERKAPLRLMLRPDSVASPATINCKTVKLPSPPGVVERSEGCPDDMGPTMTLWQLMAVLEAPPQATHAQLGALFSLNVPGTPQDVKSPSRKCGRSKWLWRMRGWSCGEPLLRLLSKHMIIDVLRPQCISLRSFSACRHIGLCLCKPTAGAVIHHRRSNSWICVDALNNRGNSRDARQSGCCAHCFRVCCCSQRSVQGMGVFAAF
jgi:hypothetical protein